MSEFENVKRILGTTLQLGSRVDTLTEESALLGSIPEMDSMAVVTVLTAIEEQYGVTIDDDEISAEIFETVGTLTEFVAAKGESV